MKSICFKEKVDLVRQLNHQLLAHVGMRLADVKRPDTKNNKFFDYVDAPEKMVGNQAQLGAKLYIMIPKIEILMQIQSRQFQQSITDSINHVQANILDITEELRSDQTHAVQSLRSTLQREMEQATQQQEQFIRDQGNATADMSRMFREEVLPMLRARNARVTLPATPAQAPPQDQQLGTQVTAPTTPAQLPIEQHQPGTTGQGLLATTVHQRNPYESMTAQAQQVSSRNRLSYTGPPPAFYVPGTPRVPSVSATMGNEPVYTSRPLYSFRSFQSANTPVRGQGHGYQSTPGYADQSATPHPIPDANNANLPGHTDQTDHQLTPQQRAAVYIGDVAAPTLDGTPEGDGNAVFTHVLDNVLRCGQVLTTILNLDGINTIHDLLSISPQYGANGLSYIPQGQTEQDQRVVTLGDIMKLRQLIAFNVTNLKHNGNQPIYYANVTAAMFNTFRACHFDPSFDYHHSSTEQRRNPARPLMPYRAGHSLVDQFRKTQKRAKSDYPLLEKDEKHV